MPRAAATHALPGPWHGAGVNAPDAPSTPPGTPAPITRLIEAGFDLVHAFDADAAAREPGLGLLAARSTGGGRLGILVGNTRALWPRFTAALARPELAADPDPLERYTEETIDAAFPGARIYYGHRRYGGAFLPLQRLAVATGLGALAPSHLVIHPVHGPWFALRAVILVDAAAPPLRAPIAQPCRCGPACAGALAGALAARGPGAWRAWLGVRDACTLRGHRYSEDQIRYHYLRVWPAGS
jgi:methylmalonic aciduria homocystinuria type C protein